MWLPVWRFLNVILELTIPRNLIFNNFSINDGRKTSTDYSGIEVSIYDLDGCTIANADGTRPRRNANTPPVTASIYNNSVFMANDGFTSDHKAGVSVICTAGNCDQAAKVEVRNNLSMTSLTSLSLQPSKKAYSFYSNLPAGKKNTIISATNAFWDVKGIPFLQTDSVTSSGDELLNQNSLLALIGFPGSGYLNSNANPSPNDLALSSSSALWTDASSENPDNAYPTYFAPENGSSPFAVASQNVSISAGSKIGSLVPWVPITNAGASN